MRSKRLELGVLFLIMEWFPGDCILLVVPEDLSTALAGIYGFIPRLTKGDDHRVGFGFRFGNHADFQVLYEFGPQIYTQQLKPIRTRSASYRQRIVRRRPFIELLLRAGLLQLKEEAVGFDVEFDGGYNEPR